MKKTTLTITLFIISFFTFTQPITISRYHFRITAEKIPEIEMNDIPFEGFTNEVFILKNELVYRTECNINYETNDTIKNTESYFIFSKNNPKGIYYKKNPFSETEYIKSEKFVDSILLIKRDSSLKINLPDEYYAKESKYFNDTLIIIYTLKDTSILCLPDMVTLKFRKFKTEPYFYLNKLMTTNDNKILFYNSIYHRKKFNEQLKNIFPANEWREEVEEKELTAEESKKFIEFINKLKSSY